MTTNSFIGEKINRIPQFLNKSQINQNKDINKSIINSSKVISRPEKSKSITKSSIR